ncbi:MAG: PilZ domain-containing protein [Nannocystaceae bacterium]|nr:PilZ domain-containing protein [Nannocystaceae bacterium]
MRLALTAQADDDVFSGYSEDVSVGGAKVRWADDRDLKIGDHIDVALDLPGRAEPLRARAEVRWRGGSSVCGIAFDKRAQGILAAFFASACGLSAATASAAATVPTFDPNADVVVEDTGPERPDEYEVQEAFFSQNEALDKCIAKVTNNRARQLDGDTTVEILLNPKGDRPLGVNADLPSAMAKHASFKECLRRAVAAAPFPSYDGPPVVVSLAFELDPGYEIEEEY